jgi:hypothetical protein
MRSRSIDDYPPGAILCTVYVVRTRWLNAYDSSGALIDCGSTKRFGLFLRGVQQLVKPIECKGRQGIFTVEIP